MHYPIFGYPRSGTSMVMQALEAGGMPVVKDARRDAIGEQLSDETYKVNPGSLYEPHFRDIAKKEFWEKHEGHAVKVIISTLQWFLAAAPRPIAGIFMWRDAATISKSFYTLMNTKRMVRMPTSATWDADTGEIDIKSEVVDASETLMPERVDSIERRRNRARAVLDKYDGLTLVDWQYEEVLANPSGHFSKLGWPIDAETAASVVNPSFKRFG